MAPLGDKILAYLTVNSISYSAGDYVTGQPVGEPDQILVWNEDKLGPIPSDAQLDDAYSQYQIEDATTAFNTERSSRLSATDWWAIRASEPGGTPMTQEQLDYRQTLRIMDDAEGFDVFNPNWPIKPN